MTDASEALRSIGVKHALVGGLAVGAHGWPRATQDVDFLLGDDAWLERDGLVATRVDLPVQAHGISVDAAMVRDDDATSWPPSTPPRPPKACP